MEGVGAAVAFGWVVGLLGCVLIVKQAFWPAKPKDEDVDKSNRFDPTPVLTELVKQGKWLAVVGLLLVYIGARGIGIPLW